MRRLLLLWRDVVTIHLHGLLSVRGCSERSTGSGSPSSEKIVNLDREFNVIIEGPSLIAACEFSLKVDSAPFCSAPVKDPPSMLSVRRVYETREHILLLIYFPVISSGVVHRGSFHPGDDRTLLESVVGTHRMCGTEPCRLSTPLSSIPAHFR